MTTTVVGLISNNDETHYREEVAQLAEWCGTNNLSLNVGRQRRLCWTSGETPLTTPPLTIDSSTVERVSSTKFLGVHITEDLTWTTNTMSLSKKAQQRLHFLRRLKIACLPPPILTTFYRGSNESVLNSCMVPLSHPSWTCSLHDAPAKPTASWRTPPIPPTVSSSSYHQEVGTGASEPAPPDCSAAFSPRLWEPWTQITPPPSENPCKPLPPETWTTPPPSPNTPQPYHTKEKKLYETFLCNSRCATHRWVGLYKQPEATHSPLCALDTFHTLLCVHNPTKDSAIYVYMLMHYKSSCTVPQPAAWLTMFLSAHVQYLCEAFV